MDDVLSQNQELRPTVPPPPEPEVAIRTMESDIKSFEQSGGIGATPQIFTPKLGGVPVAGSAAEPQIKPEAQKVEAQLNVPGYTGPEQAIFKTTGVISTELVSKETFNKWRLIFIIAGVLFVIAAFWLLGYFVIFPWLFPKQMPPVPVQ